MREEGTLLGFHADLGDVEVENLAIIIASYFSRHYQRPEDDEENEDNYHWGTWVLNQTNRYEQQLLEELCRSRK
jgi:hypothetical protein